ncbi:MULTISPECIES: ATP-dependent zinc protease family protein [Corallincola]|uniref:ATP-dependent zinc protease n=2 Tax=Corallincola TaxID=1775176 RepID=A0A368N463_9GAMM|nr:MULTISPECIES: RimK/LysX family protein [Corallincola]RCU45332.1 ATP-dependent zinc protease [Corallincola holothuriorum]TAA42608.1 ATP-dependent zinc protease [Corallincola spongiicola]
MDTRLIIGNLEVCHLPQLGIKELQVRVDTGAKTSSLHVDNLVRVKTNGKPHVEFDLHPDVYNLDEVVRCCAAVHDTRRIKSSNGDIEQRYVIKTLFQIGGQQWPIEITLSNRQEMTYLMLLGREAMGDRVYVDPSATFLVSEG